jgi:hypothetical protein
MMKHCMTDAAKFKRKEFPIGGVSNDSLMDIGRSDLEQDQTD